MTKQEKTKELIEDIKKVAPYIKEQDLEFIAVCLNCAYSTGAYQGGKEMAEIWNKK
jgi:hypothetical protein